MVRVRVREYEYIGGAMVRVTVREYEYGDITVGL